MLQRGAVNFHGENISPWLPTVQFGMEVAKCLRQQLVASGLGRHRRTDWSMTLLTRNNGFNTGRAGSGVVLNWDDKDLSGIFIPGRIGRLQFGMSTIAEGDDGTQTLDGPSVVQRVRQYPAVLASQEQMDQRLDL